jgi:hypothetical protein
MLGLYEHQGAELIFRPRFNLEPGRVYRAFFGLVDRAALTADYRAPLRNGGTPAQVTKIYPTAGVLPANHLKFYIYFSQPMRGGQEIFDQIEILDADGNAISEPWLTDQIWDASGRWLILYIHPGRIKLGLVLREVLGPVLEPGRDYTLVIRGAMIDANSQPLGKDVVKKFRTTAEDRVRIDLGAWKMPAPKAGTTDAVIVDFPKSLDHKSLESFLTIVDAKGTPMEGSIALGKNEQSWTFTPSRPWQNKEYRLRVDGRLEDVAGNTPTRPFDLDLEAPKLVPQPLQLTIRPRRS